MTLQIRSISIYSRDGERPLHETQTDLYPFDFSYLLSLPPAQKAAYHRADREQYALVAQQRFLS